MSLLNEDDAIDVFGHDEGNPQPLSGAYLAPPKPVQDLDASPMEYTTIPLVEDLEAFRRKSGMIELDPDIHEWLAAKGRDFQARANAIIRREMILDKRLGAEDFYAQTQNAEM